MARLVIADAHVHLWDLERNRYPWLQPAEPSGPFGKTAAIRHTYLLDDYLEDAAHQKVDRIVHVEAGWDPADTLGEMAWIQQLFDSRGAPHAHIAHIDLASDDARSLIARHAEFSLFRGVRDRLQDGDFTKSDGGDTRIDDPAWRRGLALLDAAGLAFDLQAPPPLAEKAAHLARSFEGVRFVLTHAGYPPAPDDRPAHERWREGLQRLAEPSNVFIKMSGLMLAEKHWDPSHARAAAHALLAAFGPDRVMISSNFPVDRLFASLDTLFDHYREWLSEWPEAEQRQMLHGNACRIYRMT